MFCEKCGSRMAENAKFCPSCGTRVEAQQEQIQEHIQEHINEQIKEQPEREIEQEAEFSAQISREAVPPPEQMMQRSEQEAGREQLEETRQHEQLQPQRSEQAAVQTHERMQPAAPQEAEPLQQQPQLQPPPPPQVQALPNSGAPVPTSAPSRKSPAKMAAIVAAIVLVLGCGGYAAYYFLFREADNPGIGTTTDPMNARLIGDTSSGETLLISYSYTERLPEGVVAFTTVDSVFPSNYRSLDALVTFTGYCDYGELDVLIDVEIPGFTQAFRQKVTLSRQVTKLRIVPPLVTGTLDLNSEKTAQLVYSVTEVDSGRLLVQESKNIKLYSKFDMIWGDHSNWDAFTDNILAWMTPDAPEITSLKRDAIDYLAYISDGVLSGIYGYQNYDYFAHYYDNTWVQAVAIQGAMSDIVQVRYNNSLFSMDAQQRVKLPADTLSSRSGLCIETSLVMASALQSSGMHVMLIFPPGHAQVAVEAWPGTGDYFLIETTMLPMDANNEGWNYAVEYLTKDEWWGYLSGDGPYTLGPCYVVDCELGEKLGIRAISN